ncbi:DUF1330 domain-containing protein [Paracoccus litorisediminis]|uniref:DUF1330 domain-containing protein n=1 Tax=Paracoccus litorisediminis TaxID=2006130 RepID=UPI003730FCA6
MTAYAVGQLRNVQMNDGIVDYLHGIDATLAPFGGRFIIHGGTRETLEGSPADDLIVIAFPSKAAARAWYVSPAYQVLVPLRLQGAEGDIYLMEGVGSEHRATDILDVG